MRRWSAWQIFMAKLGQAFAATFFGIIFLTVLPSNFIFPEFAELAASIHLLIIKPTISQ